MINYLCSTLSTAFNDFPDNHLVFLLIPKLPEAVLAIRATLVQCRFDNLTLFHVL